VRLEAERPLPVLLPEGEADRAPELDELRLAELRVQRRPQVVACEVRVPGDRVRPPQRAFLDELRACGQEAYTWRPSNWDQIKAVLGAS